MKHTNHDHLHFSDQDLMVKYKDKEMHVMNKGLLDSQNCWGNLKKIKELHIKRYELYDKINSEVDSKKLEMLGKDSTELEFQLQELWNFKRDINFHRFWDLPKCRCPKLDNDDTYPFGFYVVSGDCPLHGYVVTQAAHRKEVKISNPDTPYIKFDDWFDINDLKHLKALEYHHQYGKWPDNFIPDFIDVNISDMSSEKYLIKIGLELLDLKIESLEQ